MRLQPASAGDLAAVAGLMNRAFRGSGPVASWDSEAELIDGERTSEALLSANLGEQSGAQLLIGRDDDGGLVACVWLRPLGDDVWYLGSLTVEPSLQNSGTGRGLLQAAEDWITAYGGRRSRMTVVNLRHSLIAWYLRRGYRLTGGTEPFPYDDARVGVPRRPDLHFVVLEKALPA